jgi:phosphate transport system substrate-binding protein
VPDPPGPDSYPIVSYTWMLCRKVYDDPKIGATLKKVLLYGVSEGQTYSHDLGYVPLPESVARRVRGAIETIEVQSTPPAKTAWRTAQSPRQSRQ